MVYISSRGCKVYRTLFTGTPAVTTLHRRSGMLLCLAALGAAGMFLGPDGWLGIDIGAVGCAVLCAALWLLAGAKADQISNSAS
jgi:hypothetical protein